MRESRGGWQRGSGGRIKAAILNWGIRVFGISLLLVSLIVVWIYLHSIPLKTPLVVITLTHYSRPVPPNAGAMEDRVQIDRTWPSDAGKIWQGLWHKAGVWPIFAESAWSDKERAMNQLNDGLEEASVGGPNQDSVVVYLSGHGVLDDDGDPCLILESPGDQLQHFSHLKLSEVLQAIVKAYPDKVRKIVLLDCNRIDSEWSIGVIRNGFAGRLPEVVKQIRHKHLYVINSAGAGQKGWASPELGGTVFGRSVVEALNGGADRGNRSNGKISLRELASFVRERVQSWVAQRCHDLQEPQLIPDVPATDDFDFAWSERSTDDELNLISTPTEDVDLRKLEDKLKELWALHAELAPSMASSKIHAKLDGLSWETFQQGLVYYEKLLVAGDAYRSEAESLSHRLAALGNSLEKSRHNEHVTQYNLGFTNQQIWQRYEVLASDRKVVENLIEQPPKEPMPLKVAEQSIRLIAMEWAQRNARFADLPAIQQLLGLPPDNLAVEGQFLRLLTHPHGLTSLARGNPQALRDALAVRLAAERAAAISGDERVLPAVRNAINSADATRREAEDRFFTGEPRLIGEASQLWRTAEQSYGSAATQANVVHEMFVTRDRCWSELSYLVRWLDRRALVNDTTVSIAAQYAAVNTLIEDCHSFGAALDQWLQRCESSERPPEMDASVKELFHRVKDGHRRLRQAYDDQVADLGDDASDSATMHKILDVLSIPVVTGSTRIGLWETLNKVWKTQRESAAQIASVPKVDFKRERAPTTWGWPERPHPLMTLCDARYFADEADVAAPTTSAVPVTGSPAVSADNPAAIDLQMRRLASQEAAVRNKFLQARDLLSLKKPNDRSEQLAIIKRLDRQYRSLWPLVAMPLAYREPQQTMNDPWGLRVRLEWQDYGLWQASRYLEDFWGISGGTQQVPYFARIVQSLLDDCRLPGATHPQLAVIQERVQYLRQKAESAFSIEATSVIATDSSAPASSTITANLSSEVPKGWGGLWLADPSGTLVEVSTKIQDEWREREPLRFADQATPRVVVNLKSVKDAPPGKWQAHTWYRGHEAKASFDLYRQERGLSIVTQRESPKPSKIFVSGAVDKPGTIVFVLDCSASMNYPPDSAITRMLRAREALADLLTEVVEAGGYDVSLWFYGHRLGVRKDSSVARQEGWNIPEHVTPGTDVERVWPSDGAPQLLDASSLETSLKPLIQRAKPHGITPLYLAIKSAVEKDLAQAKQRMAPRRVIVITDGVNYQTDNVTPISAITTVFAEDYKSVSNDQLRIQIDVIGFEVGQALNAEDAPKLDELRTVIQSPVVRGKYYDAKDHKELNDTLRRLLDRYRIRTNDDKQVVVDSRLLNREFEFPEAHKKGTFAISLPQDEAVATRFRLDGGENLILRLINTSDGRKQFVHERYTRSQEIADEVDELANPLATNDTIAAGPQRVYMAAHTAERHADGLLIPLSIQNHQKEGFSPRPLEAWVEVRPTVSTKSASDTARVYHFYDLQFESWTPVPVMKLLARDWPEECDQAEVQAWFKYAYTEPKIHRRLDETLGSNGVAHPDMILELGGNRSIELVVSIDKLGAGSRGAVVNVLERHVPRSASLGHLRVQLDEPADRIQRTWYAEDGAVQHQFTYLARSAEELRKTNFVSITLREDIERNAVHPPRPLKFFVPAR